MKKVVVIGSGLAGSLTALYLEKYCEVLLITKGTKTQSNSYLAQGGIATSIAEDDSLESHVLDTLKAGNFKNDETVVSTILSQGNLVLKELMDKGLNFDKTANGELVFSMEGAHSKKRILHCKGDQTGKYMTKFVQESLEHTKIIEETSVIELLKDGNSCIGVKTLSKTGEVTSIYANDIVLATGGIGQLFVDTSNDETITGDGLTLALQIGAKVQDLAYIQFHPTLLSYNNQTYGLISEAVRGEGAQLVLQTGERIMEHVHPYQDLAPRDIVARTIFQKMKEQEKVFLDVSKVENFEERFPSIFLKLQKNGFDLSKDKLIPISCGEHFLMGGVACDAVGRTNIGHLYALGEVASTGLHGANRLASNSLLEILAMAKAVAENIRESAEQTLKTTESIHEVREDYMFNQAEKEQFLTLKEKTQLALGIVRNKDEVRKFLDYLKVEQTQPHSLLYAQRLRLLHEIASQILEEEESCGAHYWEEKDECFNA